MGRPAIAVILFVSSALSVLAQTSAPSHVLIPLIATDRHKQPIQDLTSASLVVSDTKARVNDIQLLRGSDLPLEIGILLDTSTSERNGSFKEIAEGAKDFVNNILREPDDRIFFMTFDILPATTEWMTRQQSAGVVIRVKIGGGTALYDAVSIACRDRMGPQDWRHAARRLLVLVSDGGDNSSHITKDAAITEALKSGAVIFALSPRRGDDAGDRSLEQFTKKAGGEFFPQVDKKEVNKTFARINEIIDSMVYLDYVPPSRTTGLHDVEVKAVSKQKIELSYPKNYFWTQ